MKWVSSGSDWLDYHAGYHDGAIAREVRNVLQLERFGKPPEHYCKGYRDGAKGVKPAYPERDI